MKQRRGWHGEKYCVAAQCDTPATNISIIYIYIIVGSILFAASFLSKQAFGQEKLALLNSSITLQRTYASITPNYQWTNQSCNGCHQIDATFSHPVGMAPSMKVPLALPLTNGKVTCITCHDNTSAQAHAQARQNHTSMLRDSGQNATDLTSSVNLFCAKCHDASQNNRRAMHGVSLGLAHLSWGKSSSEFAAKPRRQTADRSRLCQSCHDGMMISGTNGSSGFLETSAHRDSHPAGTDYRQSRQHQLTSRGVKTLVAAETLHGQVRLFEGKISCESCHSPYSTNKKLLVMDNHASRLCQTCHAM